MATHGRFSQHKSKETPEKSSSRPYQGAGNTFPSEDHNDTPKISFSLSFIFVLNGKDEGSDAACPKALTQHGQAAGVWTTFTTCSLGERNLFSKRISYLSRCLPGLANLFSILIRMHCHYKRYARVGFTYMAGIKQPDRSKNYRPPEKKEENTYPSCGRHDHWCTKKETLSSPREKLAMPLRL